MGSAESKRSKRPSKPGQEEPDRMRHSGDVNVMADQLSADLASLRIDREEPARRSRWPGRLAVLALLAAVGVVAARWGPAWVESALFKPEVSFTEVVMVSPVQASIDLSATGHVAAQVVAKVGSKVSGRIAQVAIREGDSVEAGQLLFELDPTDERSALASAAARVQAARARAQASRAALGEAELQRERETELAARGATPRARVEDLEARVRTLVREAEAAEAEVKVTQAEVASLRQNVKNMAIVAPVSGTAVSRPAQLGDVIGPEVVLVELADFSTLLVEADVPEGRLGRIRKGGPCEVVLDSAPDSRLRGEVAEVSPRLDRAKATATVKIRVLDEARLLPNMAARVSFLQRPLDAAELTLPPRKVVPVSAVVRRNGASALWLVDRGKVRRVTVTVGREANGTVELAKGPPAGTRVVDRPPVELQEGQAVKEAKP